MGLDLEIHRSFELFALGIPFFLLYWAPMMGLGALSAPWVVIIASVFGTVAIARVFLKPVC